MFIKLLNVNYAVRCFFPGKARPTLTSNIIINLLVFDKRYNHHALILLQLDYIKDMYHTA